MVLAPEFLLVNARCTSSVSATALSIKHVRCNPDVGPRLNLVDATTPTIIFARGGAGFVSLIKIS